MAARTWLKGDSRGLFVARIVASATGRTYGTCRTGVVARQLDTTMLATAIRRSLIASGPLTLLSFTEPVAETVWCDDVEYSPRDVVVFFDSEIGDLLL